MLFAALSARFLAFPTALFDATPTLTLDFAPPRAPTRFMAFQATRDADVPLAEKPLYAGGNLIRARSTPLAHEPRGRANDEEVQPLWSVFFCFCHSDRRIHHRPNSATKVASSSHHIFALIDVIDS